MAYGLKYWYQFEDIHPINKATWKVEILFKDFTGNEVEIETLASVPLKFIRGKQSDNKFEPILGSEADLGIVITDEVKINPSDFFAIDEDQARVDIYKNGNLYWKGFLKQDFIQYPYTSTPYNLYITATDRLSLMKSHLLDVNDEKHGDGYISLLSLLTEKGIAQTELGAGLDIFSSLKCTDVPDYPIFINEHLFPFPLYIRYELFYDDSGNAINVYDSLRSLAASFGGRIFYSNGKFWFQRIEDLQSPLLRTYSFDENGNSTSNYLFDPRRIIKGELSSSDGIYANNNAQIQINGAHKQEKIDLDYLFRGYLKNHSWSDFVNGQFTYWDASDWSLISQGGEGSIQKPYFCEFLGDRDGTSGIWQTIDLTFQYTINISVKIDMNGCERAAWQLHTYYNSAAEPRSAYVNGKWVDTDGTLDHKYNNMIERPDNNTGIYDLNISIPPPPPQSHPTPPYFVWDNQIQLIFIDPDGGGYEMKIYDVQLSVITNGYTGEIDTARSDKNYSILNDVDNILYVDGLENIANSLRYRTGGVSEDPRFTVFNFGGKWKSSFGESNEIQKFNILSRLNQNKTPYKTLKSDFFSNTIDFENVMQQAYGNYDLYMQMYDEYDVKKCIHKMQLLQINETDSFNDEEFDVKQVFKPTGKGLVPIRTF